MAVVSKKIRPYLFLMQVRDFFAISSRNWLIVDGPTTNDRPWKATIHEEEQDGGKFVLLDRVDDGVPFLVSFFFSHWMDSGMLTTRAVCYLRF